jgi:hypothetical protein
MKVSDSSRRRMMKYELDGVKMPSSSFRLVWKDDPLQRTGDSDSSSTSPFKMSGSAKQDSFSTKAANAVRTAEGSSDSGQSARRQMIEKRLTESRPFHSRYYLAGLRDNLRY